MAVQTLGLTESGREREMSVYLRGLVDTVLEEGNLDSAIVLLDRLRSPAYKPYGPHVRNLLYLALFPPPSAADVSAASAPVLDTIPSSPSKFPARQRQAFLLSSVLIEKAQDVLRILVQTNSPDSIARALPNYGLSGFDGLPEIMSIAENDEDDGESELARLSKRIKDARSCWEIIQEHYIRHDAFDDIPNNNMRKGGRRVAVEPQFVKDESEDPPRPVADHAFSVLESLVALFEKEELLMSMQHEFRFSPHFLAQIPASRTPSGARWDVAAPLDVVFYCLQHADHAELGVRILNLLMNLSNTIHLDLAMLLNAVVNRLSHVSDETLQSMFSLLPSSATSLRFQVSLCQLCLTHSSSGDQRSRPRPQARNAPRPIPLRATEDSSTKGGPSLPDTSTTLTFARKLPPLHFADILQTFSAQPSASDVDSSPIARRLHFKFLLISAVGALQEQATPEERDAEWRRIVQSGELAQATQVAFAIPESQAADAALAEDLKTMLSLVIAGWCRW